MTKTKETKELEIVNKATGELIKLPSIMKPLEKGLLIGENPIDFRALTSKDKGYFSIQGQTNESDSIDFHVFDYLVMKGIRPSEEYDNPTDFIQLIGLATMSERRVYAVLTFSSSSVGRLLDALAIIELKGGTLKNVFKIKLEATANKKNQKFYVPSVSFREATQDELFDVVSLFEHKPDAATRFRELPNIDEQS